MKISRFTVLYMYNVHVYRHTQAYVQCTQCTCTFVHIQIHYHVSPPNKVLQENQKKNNDLLHTFSPQVYSGAHGRTMIFTKTKQEANELALSSALKQDCQVLHGDIPQKQREITLKVHIFCMCGTSLIYSTSKGHPETCKFCPSLGCAHTGRQWSAPTTTQATCTCTCSFAPPSKLASSPGNHHSDHSGHIPVHIGSCPFPIL